MRSAEYPLTCANGYYRACSPNLTVSLALTSVPILPEPGFPAFPDPNGQGAFVLDNFDMGSPRAQSAFKTCVSLTKFKGPMRVAISNQGP